MSPLWKSKENKKLKTIQKRPSPKYKNHILSLAQGLISFLDRKFPNQIKDCNSIKGISLHTSALRKISGSMTVEAAVVLPLFLFFFLNLGYAIELIRLHGNLELALWEVGNRAAVYSYVLAQEDFEQEGLLQTVDGITKRIWRSELAGLALGYLYFDIEMVDYLGKDYLDASPLTKGALGLSFLESGVEASEDCIDVVVTYSVSPFSEMAGFGSFRMANRYYGHVWNGYRIPGTEGREEVVFVAENGTVYHTDRGCTHLTLSIRQVSWQEASVSRNEQGGKYAACEKCCAGEQVENVYITSEGDCYHYTNQCSGLKRTVISLPVSQIDGLPICSRCAQE